ncbi:MAG: hypothetical protein ACHQQQ_14325 [Bacteroidota bacterium]
MVFLISIPRLLLSVSPAVFLLWIIVLLWKEKEHLGSVFSIIFGVFLLAIARGLDVIVQYPSIAAALALNLHDERLITNINSVGDFFDVTGVFFLINGFIRTIKFQLKEEEHIRELETLLPICANCKKIRKEDQSWETIEEYLQHTGAPPLTHGICPDCKTKMLSYFKAK